MRFYFVIFSILHWWNQTRCWKFRTFISQIAIYLEPDDHAENEGTNIALWNSHSVDITDINKQSGKCYNLLETRLRTKLNSVDFVFLMTPSSPTNMLSLVFGRLNCHYIYVLCRADRYSNILHITCGPFYSLDISIALRDFETYSFQPIVHSEFVRIVKIRPAILELYE